MDKLTIDQLRIHLKSLERLGDKERPLRVERASRDFRYAVKTYFSHHVSQVETSKFRNEFYDDCESLLKHNKKMSFEAYRGAAKTTLITRLHTLFKTAIQREKRHTIIISSIIDVSKETLDFIKTELEDNAQLIADFEIKQGDIWSSEEIIFYSGELKFRIKVYGAGKKIRGANWLGFRPDLIICDDIENDENVESKAQREKLYKWFIKAIMKLPSRQSTTYNIIVVGTKLHHDGFLSRLQQRSDFVSFRYPLVLEFPSNLDEIDKEYVKGIDVIDMKLDDESLNKLELLKEYLEDKDSFMSEFQNEPLSRDGTTFSDFQTFDTLCIPQSITIGIDPALGKTSGDYFSITVLLHDGKKFYASTKMYRIKATLMIDKIISLYIDLLKYGVPIKMGIETVQFQEFFKDTLDERCKSIGLYLPIVPLKNTVSKDLRIDGIAPPVNNGVILIDKKSLLLIDELETYPKAPHDDGLDSLEMAYRIAKKPAFDYKEAHKHLKNKEAKNKALEALLSS